MSTSKLKSYFLNLLSKKDYSEQELRDKAEYRGFESQEIETELESLRNLNYLNDSRMAKNIAENYLGYKGQVWLKQKLASRKISEIEIANTLQIYELEPNQDFKQKIERKYGVDDWSKLDVQTKQKVIRFIQSQGFNQAYQILKSLSEN